LISLVVNFKFILELSEFTNEKLCRYVCQHFSDIIVATGHDLEQEEQMIEFKQAHKLILQINKYVPTLLLNVIPQLQEELKVLFLFLKC
jgi:sister-chromatid-cohesion protein PDS5